MANCEDCFDRAVTIPVGPTGATGATGATGPAGADGADGEDGIIVLIDEFGFTTSDLNSYTSLKSGTIPANSLDKVGDALRVEFSAVGAATGTATYNFKITLGGVDMGYAFITDSNISKNQNAIHGVVDLVVINLSPFTLRVHVKQMEKVVGLYIPSTTYTTWPSLGSSLGLYYIDTTTDAVGLVTPTVNNTLAIMGKNSNGAAPNVFLCPRLSVKLLKHI